MEVEILLCEELVVWRTRKAHGSPLNPPSKRHCPRHFFRKRILAFPVHSKTFQHWTLGILVNLKWSSRKATTNERTDEEWRLFHFDSLGCIKDVMRQAQEFASYLVELPTTSIMATMIPCLVQPSMSNDCGLYPFHFLRVFLRDRERSIHYCLQVCSPVTT